jgi:hypothetical protein
MSRLVLALLTATLLLVAADLSYGEKPIRNHTTWTDTAGNPISGHDGGITRVGDTFYWYGTSYQGNQEQVHRG